MNAQNLITAFKLLDEFLSSGKPAPVWLVVGGGSALLVQQFSTRQTKDVDVMALREWESVKQAATRVAEELRLAPDWLNGAASLHSINFALLPPWFWQELDTREYGKSLKISFIGRKGLILLKLGAALDRDQRRDMEDLASLNATRDELEKLLRWVLSNLYETSTHPKLPTLLKELGHADLISRFQ